VTSPDANLPGPDGPDVLQRAAAALRAAHGGQREGSGFTRARILATVAERRRPRLRRWLVLAPLGSALLVGSAWAQSTGSWPRVWQAVATVLPFVNTEHAEAPERRRPRATSAPPTPSASPRPAPAPEAVPPAEPVTPPTAQEPAVPTAQEPAVSVAPPASRPRRAAPTPAGASSSEPPDPELRRFRAAHELHVLGQSRAAISAYGDYLQAYPRGRFVPEARYNSALDAIKIGDHAAARRLLQPFADGAHGGYRRSEAQRLLEALAGGSSGSGSR
jgi:hypothetical protein